MEWKGATIIEKGRLLDYGKGDVKKIINILSTESIKSLPHLLISLKLQRSKNIFLNKNLILILAILTLN